MQIQINWLHQKPTDLDLHCLQRQDISEFSRSRVKLNTYVRRMRKKNISNKETSASIKYALLYHRNRKKNIASKIGTTLKGKNLFPSREQIPSLKSSPYFGSETKEIFFKISPGCA